MVLDIIKKTLREYNLLNNGDSVLVGLSGGATARTRRPRRHRQRHVAEHRHGEPAGDRAARRRTIARAG